VYFRGETRRRRGARRTPKAKRTALRRASLLLPQPASSTQTGECLDERKESREDERREKP